MATPKNTDEHELAALMSHGDEQAMRQVYRLYAGYLSAVCSRYVPNREDQRDILQEAFIKAFTHAASFSPKDGASLKSWLARIVVNESLNFLKRSKRYSFIDKEETIPDVPNDDVDTTGIAFQTIIDMIQQLPTGYRTVFNLYVFEKKPHREIARLLGITEGTSASQYLRAKRILAKQINEYKRQQL